MLHFGFINSGKGFFRSQLIHYTLLYRHVTPNATHRNHHQKSNFGDNKINPPIHAAVGRRRRSHCGRLILRRERRSGNGCCWWCCMSGNWCCFKSYRSTNSLIISSDGVDRDTGGESGHLLKMSLLANIGALTVLFQKNITSLIKQNHFFNFTSKK